MIQVKNIKAVTINVAGLPLLPDEIAEVDLDKEIKNLIAHKYVEKVKQ